MTNYGKKLVFESTPGSWPGSVDWKDHIRRMYQSAFDSQYSAMVAEWAEAWKSYEIPRPLVSDLQFPKWRDEKMEEQDGDEMNSIKLPCGIEWKNGQELAKSGLFLSLDCDGKHGKLHFVGIRYQSGNICEMKKAIYFSLGDNLSGLDGVSREIEEWLVGEMGADFVRSLGGAVAVNPDPADGLERVIEAAQKAIDVLLAAINAAKK